MEGVDGGGSRGREQVPSGGGHGGSDEAPGQGEYPWGTEEGKP